MFGEMIDTRLLRLIAHNKNIRTEDEIEAAAANRVAVAGSSIKEEYFIKFTTRAGNHFNWKNKKILDVACGLGNLSNALAKNGAQAVWGIDLQGKHIKEARAIAQKENVKNVIFVEADFLSWETGERFDYIISNEALDHIPDCGKILQKMAMLLSPTGKIINIEGGFWRGPSADHCDRFMRIFIPWRHLLFNEKALLNVRREMYRPTDLAKRFEDIRGGLSKFTFSGYLKAIDDAGLKINSMETNFQLRFKNKNVIRFFSNVVTKIPFIGEFFIFSSLAVLSRST